MRTITRAMSRHLLALVVLGTGLGAQQVQPAKPGGPASGGPGETKGVAAVVPSDYKIGVGDLLKIVFWREPEISGDVVVRPDGKITLPLLKEVAASGLTPTQLEAELANSAKRFIHEPNATVVVTEIKSRQVFATGNVAHPGAYPLHGPTTILQFIAQAGGLLEFADSENVLVMRTENGKSLALKFNYKDITRQKNLQQNVELKPGDTVIVP